MAKLCRWGEGGGDNGTRPALEAAEAALLSAAVRRPCSDSTCSTCKRNQRAHSVIDSTCSPPCLSSHPPCWQSTFAQQLIFGSPFM